MPWTLADSAELGPSVLHLYEDEGVFMIRVDGWELMNGRHHGSEQALGRIAAELAKGPAPSVLLGGLGLGFTLEALVDALPDEARVLVVELSEAMVQWFDGRIRPGALARMTPKVDVAIADVLEVIRSGQAFDIAVLDVDNGPEALSSPGNSRLYDQDGLRALFGCLRPGGAALVWSGFEDRDFEERARQIGFAAKCRPVEATPGARALHYLFILKRPD